MRVGTAVELPGADIRPHIAGLTRVEIGKRGDGSTGPPSSFQARALPFQTASAWHLLGALRIDRLTGSGLTLADRAKLAQHFIHLISHAVLCGMSIAK